MPGKGSGCWRRPGFTRAGALLQVCGCSGGRASPRCTPGLGAPLAVPGHPSRPAAWRGCPVPVHARSGEAVPPRGRGLPGGSGPGAVPSAWLGAPEPGTAHASWHSSATGPVPWGSRTRALRSLCSQTCFINTEQQQELTKGAAPREGKEKNRERSCEGGPAPGCARLSPSGSKEQLPGRAGHRSRCDTAGTPQPPEVPAGAAPRGFALSCGPGAGSCRIQRGEDQHRRAWCAGLPEHGVVAAPGDEQGSARCHLRGREGPGPRHRARGSAEGWGSRSRHPRGLRSNRIVAVCLNKV